MYVIIGQGASGTHAAARLRQLDPRAPVTVVSGERDYFYSRIDLPDVVAGKLGPAETVLQPAEFFAARNIDCRMGAIVDAIDPAQKRVKLASGDVLRYDKLLLATGSRPVIPALDGVEATGVYGLWTLAQARAIAAAVNVRSAVVIGAGLIGLKTATALAARGIRVTIVEKLPRIMPRQLDTEAAGLLDGRIRGVGIEILTGTGVEALVAEDGAVRGVALAHGRIDAQMVIVSVGVRANIELAATAGIATGRGIRVDEFQQTSQADIYAAGDVAETVDRLTGEATIPAIWPVAVEQGRIAAANMVGQRERYAGSPAMNSVEIAGLPMVSVGAIEPGPGDEVFVSRRGEAYRKVIVHGDRVRGIVCLGDIRQAGALSGLVHSQHPVDRVERLISPYFSYADLIAA